MQTARQHRGASGFHAGVAAEESVARTYEAHGCEIAHRRWRGEGGEIDLIARNGRDVVFIEVKKSRCFATAATRLGRRQMDRLCLAAQEFCATEPNGLLTDMRFDLALVDGQGRVHIIENAFGEA